jgi:hypothetical protein
MNATRNWTYLIVTAIVRLYMLGALAISFSHIEHASTSLGLTGWPVLTVPFFIDGFAVLGMIGRSSRFAEATRRTGFRLQLAAGALSFAANIYAGQNTGERIYGALVVAGFVTAEWYGAKLAPAVVVAPVEPVAPVVDELPAPAAPASSRKGQPWSPERRARHEAKRAAKQAVADEIAALEDALKLASAPVSPAPGESAAYL